LSPPLGVDGRDKPGHDAVGPYAVGPDAVAPSSGYAHPAGAKGAGLRFAAGRLDKPPTQAWLEAALRLCSRRLRVLFALAFFMGLFPRLGLAASIAVLVAGTAQGGAFLLPAGQGQAIFL